MATVDIDRLIEEYQGIKLDIACGQRKSDGWIGMDIRDLPGVDIVHDCEVMPWPLPDECVILAVASHIVEHINPHKFGFIRFMDEAWRVMRAGAQLNIVTPHGNSPGYVQDPTHCNPCNEATWAYFAPEHPSGLWQIYQPKPWRIARLFSDPSANMRLQLVKLDPNHRDE